MSPEELALILRFSDGGRADYPAGAARSVVELFQNQAALTPQAIALEEADGRTTDYETFDSEIRTLASALYFSKIAPRTKDSPYVAVLLSNGKEYLRSAGAVMSCRKAFVPLDPDYPVHRLRTILTDLDDPLLITTSKHANLLQKLDYNKENVLFADEEAGKGVSRALPPFQYAPDDVAYCLYTSGSTGVPKGVPIDQRSVLNWAGWIAEEFELRAGDRSVAFSNPTFDVSIGQTWPFLCSGGTVVIPPVCPTSELHRFVESRRITVLYLPTVVGETFFEQTHLKDLRWLLFAGEVLRSIVSARLSSDLPFGICNCYGPTEATISLTYQKFAPGDRVNLSVGRPIPNHAIFVLDDNQDFVGVGVEGEVYLSGIGLSTKGYRNRPEENRNVFVPAKWDPNLRLCRIGDLGLWREDGGLEIRGRTDSRVKIRGFRVELGEVESQLLSHPAIKHAIVLHDTELELLNAYVIAQETHGLLKTDDILEFLGDRLPKHSRPSRIFQLDEFPINSNGKIDKARLGQLEGVDSDILDSTPADSLEACLIQVWSKLLKIPSREISMNSNFFELGGHSRLGVELICCLRKALNRPHLLNFMTVFSHPTVREFLTVLTRAMEGGTVLLPPTRESKESQSSPFPLSFAQEQLWLSEEEKGSSSTDWNIVRVLQFQEPVSVEILEKTLELILRKHDSLRSTAFSVDGRAWQRITSPPSLKVMSLDIEADLLSISIDLRKEFFDMKQGPLIKFHLHGEHFLFISYHHIIMDGHGWAILLKDMDTVYNTLPKCPSPEKMLPPLPTSFREAVLWERSQTLPQTSVDYWKGKLNGFKPIALRPTPPAQTNSPRSKLELIQLPSDLSIQLHLLASQERTTIFTLLLTIFKTLVHRHTGEEDMTLLTLFRSGQSLEGSEELIGHFVNLIPVRTTLSSEIPFRKYLEQTREVLAQGLNHGGVPYQRIISELAGSSRADKNQLLKVMFQMRARIEGGLGSFKEVWLQELGAPQIDLGMDVCDNDPEGIVCAIEYNPDVFTQNFIQRFLAQYSQLCSNILTSPEEGIGALDILPPTQRRELLEGFSCTESSPLRQESLLTIFQGVVEKQGSANCVTDSRMALTYDEVDRLSTNIASAILESADPLEEFVAILLPRGSFFIPSTIGIAKSGRIIAPLNLSHPKQSILSMLTDLGNPLVLTDRSTASTISAYYDRLLVLENISNPTPPHPHTPLIPRAKDDLFYCFFTSGTTGAPKGVLLKQTSALNVLGIYTERMELRSGDRSLFFHSPGFDASLADFWPALLTGGHIMVPEEAVSYDPTLLWKYIIEARINYANIPTVLAENIFSSYPDMEAGLGGDLRWLAFGGERLKVLPPKGFPANCLNAYGPTEATVDATHSSSIAPLHADAQLSNIGRPIPNVKVYILDQYMCPVPIGVEGVLWIGGIGLARGYLKHPKLSSSVFRPNPFEGGEEVYCSGDVARWDEDGSIRILGRKDEQVKVNGIRVELEGIESALLTHPRVLKAGVTCALNAKAAVSHFVAFCTARSGGGPAESLADIKAYLGTRLAPYAIPQALHWIESLPLSPNGKLDRKALSVLYKEKYAQKNKVQGPVPQHLTKTETELAMIWSKLLSVDMNELGPDTNFYEVGGSSLMVGALVREINNGSPSPSSILFKDIFEHSSLGRLAKHVEVRRQESELGLLDRNSLSPHQKYIWFHQAFQLGEQSPVYNRHRLFQLNNSVSKESLEAGVRSVLDRFSSALGLQIQVSQGQLLVSTFPLSVFRSFQNFNVEPCGTNIESFVAQELATPFDLTTGRRPLIRLKITSSPTQGLSYICFFWHHILDTSGTVYSALQDLLEHVPSLSVPKYQQIREGAKVRVSGGPFAPETSVSSILARLEIASSQEELKQASHGAEAKETDLFRDICLNARPKVEEGTESLEESESRDTDATKIWRTIIAKLWSLVLGVPLRTIFDQPHAHFFALGGTSSELLQAASWLSTLTGHQCYPLSHYYRYASLDGLCRSFQFPPVASPQAALPYILQDEVTAATEKVKRVFSPYEHRKTGNVVFLTGATGYVGAFIAEALMAESGISRTYCLLRGSPERLLDSLKKFGIRDDVPSTLIPLSGDLSEPFFGLPAETYAQLTAEVNIICHCGAEVNLVQGYAQQKAANVVGSQNILAFARTGKGKALHYISTTDAGVGRFLFETTEQVMEGRLGPPPYLEPGYYQSKWVAESLVLEASEVIPTRIYRVGTVGVHSSTRPQPSLPATFDGMFIRACVHLRAYPDLNGFTVPYSDVDWVANFIRKGLLAPPGNRTDLFLNVVQKNIPHSQVFEKLGLPAISADVWFSRFLNLCENNVSDVKSQSLRLILEQRPWGRLGLIKNFFGLLSFMPKISYPESSTPGLFLREGDGGSPQIEKYVELHCQ